LPIINQDSAISSLNSDVILIYTTTPDTKTGAEIARTLLNERLVACVNVLPDIRSLYRWKGEICDETETALIMKTTSECFKEVEARIRQLHPYELPEIISIPISNGLADYLNWVHTETS